MTPRCRQPMGAEPYKALSTWEEDRLDNRKEETDPERITVAGMRETFPSQKRLKKKEKEKEKFNRSNLCRLTMSVYLICNKSDHICDFQLRITS